MKQVYTTLPNPDFVHRKQIEETIKENDGYCCCALEKIDDTKCMCKDFREQEETGFCHCGRYYKVLKAPKVYLCGNMQCKEFYTMAEYFTLQGYIVLIPFNIEAPSQESKVLLKELCKAKIADADFIYVINKNYNDSLKDEIDWAEELNKKIEYLEP